MIGNVAIADIEVGHVLKAVEPHWHRVPKTAKDVLGRIEELVDFARVAGLRRDDLNPAKWRSGLDAVLPAPSRLRPTQHHPAMPYARRARLHGEATRRAGISGARARTFVLTATRMNELLGAKWDEIDGDVGRSRPRPDEKAPAACRAARPARSRSCAGCAAQDPMLVFPGRLAGKPISDNSLHRVLHRLAGPEHTAHGFRSAFRDFAAERTGFAPEIAEAALAHAVKSAVDAAYRERPSSISAAS